MSMMQGTTVNRDASPSAQPQAQSEFKQESMPTTSRTNIFSRAASVAAMTVALATTEAPAQTPATVPVPPTPAVAPAVPMATPAAAPVAEQVMTDKTNITKLEDRKFCMDDDGNVLIPRKTQVRQIGQTVQGLPSYGEAFRAICEGVERLKDLNGGQIPPGQDVKLRIRAQNGEDTINRSLPLNPKRLVGNADLCPDAVNKTMADPMNKKALEAIRNELNIHVERTGKDTVTITFIGKEPGQAVLLTVELAPRQ